MIRKVLFCVSSWFIFQYGHAQDPLVNYTATSFKDGVLISFIMRGGFSCNGINIERSEDSAGFSVIGDIEGICGNPDFDVPFSFTDVSPLPNRKNFYRLNMKQLGYSKVISVFFIKPNAEGMMITPNPCTDRCRIYFENTKRERVMVELFRNAKLTFAQATDQNFVELEAQPFVAGVYFCRLRYDGGALLNKKLVLIKP